MSATTTPGIAGAESPQADRWLAPFPLVVLFSGHLADDGRLARFAADWRAAQAIARALEEEAPVRVALEGWQLL